MNKIIAVGIIIALLANIAVLLVGFGYLQDEINQLKLDVSGPSSTPTPTLTPTPTPPTSTPAPTGTPSPAVGTPANLICNVHNLSFATDGGLRLLIKADIVNTGAQTAYNVSLHIQTWFSNGAKGMDTVVRLNDQVIWILPPEQVDIAGGATYTLHSRWFGDNLVLSVPGEFWLDEWGKVYHYDLISTYSITPIWSDTP